VHLLKEEEELTKISYIGLYLEFGLYSLPVYTCFIVVILFIQIIRLLSNKTWVLI
jgi:hypothetical protein